jgi:hypothetical protein
MNKNIFVIAGLVAVFGMSNASAAPPVNVGPGQGDGSCVGNCSGNSGNGGIDNTVDINNRLSNTSSNFNANTAKGGNANALGGAASSSSSASGGKASVGDINASSTNTLSNAQDQGQLQGQSQNVNDSGNSNQGQTQSANNNGNAQNVNINTPRQHRNTPGMANFTPMPSANCMATVGGAGAGPGIGVSISGSYINEECEIRETSRNFYAIGQSEAAVETACLSKHATQISVCQEIRNERANNVNQVSQGTNNQVVSSDNRVYLDGNAVKNLQSGKTYGYVVNGSFKEINTVPFDLRTSVQTLVDNNTL